jgi:predicted nucleic acid-binding protein
MAGGQRPPAFAERVLPIDLAATRILATYRVPEHAPYDDAVIAATAQARGAVVATRNTQRFAPLAVETVNPWEPATWR